MTVVVILQHRAFAQNSTANVWNDYSGSSSSALITFNGYDTATGSPELDVTIGSESGGGSGVPLPTATMDTGSTGALISITQACRGGVIACTGNGPTNYAPASQSEVLGYGVIGYSSSGIYYDGLYADAKITISSGSGGHRTEATSSVPVFIATSIEGDTQAAGPAPTGLGQFGVGFGRTANATGIALTNQQGVANGVVLYGTQINPLLNLTQVNVDGTLTSDLSALAPGYVVTKAGIYLGLSTSDVGSTAALVHLAGQPQNGPASTVSAYATAATTKDWQPAPIVLNVTQNSAPNSLDGVYYGTMLVDTGIGNAYLTTGATANGGAAPSINRSLLNSSTNTNIGVALAGLSAAGDGQPGQFVYVFQGYCSTAQGNADGTGCGPNRMPYNGNATAEMVGVYPTSTADSSKDVPGENTGFGQGSGTPPYLNTGVDFLNSFDVVYDPVSGFIGYVPVSADSSVSRSLLSIIPMISLQNSVAIPDGTDVVEPLFLFTGIGNETTPVYAPVDVALSTYTTSGAPGSVTISQPISSDLIAGCTQAICSTGLVIEDGRFIFDAANTYGGATTVDAGASLVLGAGGGIANSSNVTIDGSFDISNTAAGASITSLSGSGNVNLGSETLTLTDAGGTFGGTSGGSGGLAVAAGTEMLTGNNSYSGPTTVDAGASLVLGAGGGIANSSNVTIDGSFDISNTAAGASIMSLSGSGNVNLGGETLTLTDAGDAFAGTIVGAGGLTVAGGAAMLTASNSYAGPTTIDAGAALALGGDGSIANSSTLVANGMFDISNIAAGAAVASLSGAGVVDLGSQTLTLTDAASSFAGIVGGTGGLTVVGGAETLTGTNSYSGPTTVNAGTTLALGGDGSIANSSNLIANGRFDISNTTAGAAIASLSGAGVVNLGSQTLTLTNANGTFAGTIGGTGGLAVTGGTEALTGSNGYAGGTVVADGATLAVASDAALGASGSPLILDDGTLVALADVTTERPVLIGSGGGTLDASGFDVALDGTVNSDGTVTVGNGTTSINGQLVASALDVAGNGILHGIGTIDAPTRVAGTVSPGNSPGTLTFTAPVALLPSATTVIDIDGTGTGTGAGNYSRVIVTGAGNTFTASGQLQPLLRGISGSATNTYTPALGQSFQIVQAQGGVAGVYSGLAAASGLPAGTRFDTLYGSDAISLVVTPSFYGDLAAAGLPESRYETSVGTALDAVRPAAGVAMTSAQSALFDPLYALPASGIPAALEELSPSIYSDALVTARNAWYLVANSVDSQLASRRGLAPDSAGDSAAGPRGSTIWMTALAAYDTTSGGGGAPSFTSGLGGGAAGVDAPVADTGRIGLAVGSVDGQTWTQSGGQATGTTAQLVGYGQWQSGKLFVAAQLGGMYQQENVMRNLPVFGTSTRGDTNGTAGGGGVRIGMQQALGSWLLEPSLGFGGFSFQEADLTETGGAPLAEHIGGQSIASGQSTLGVSLQRGLAVSSTVSMVAKGELGWSHEFASNTADSWASFSGLSGSGYQVVSAPVGRDAALVGMLAEVKVASWPVSMFAGYGGAISGSSNAQSFNAGLHFMW